MGVVGEEGSDNVPKEMEWGEDGRHCVGVVRSIEVEYVSTRRSRGGVGLMMKWRRSAAAYIGLETPEYGRSRLIIIPTIPLAHRVWQAYESVTAAQI